jgi:hypothetical protein
VFVLGMVAVEGVLLLQHYGWVKLFIS